MDRGQGINLLVLLLMPLLQTVTRQGNLGLYNFLYNKFFGRNSTFEELLEREAIRVNRDAFLSMKYDPHMQHQVRPLSDWVDGWLGWAAGQQSVLQRLAAPPRHMLYQVTNAGSLQEAQ
jgi:hypothetical protein